MGNAELEMVTCASRSHENPVSEAINREEKKLGYCYKPSEEIEYAFKKFKQGEYLTEAQLLKALTFAGLPSAEAADDWSKYSQPEKKFSDSYYIFYENFLADAQNRLYDFRSLLMAGIYMSKGTQEVKATMIFDNLDKECTQKINLKDHIEPLIDSIQILLHHHIPQFAVGARCSSGEKITRQMLEGLDEESKELRAFFKQEFIETVFKQQGSENLLTEVSRTDFLKKIIIYKIEKNGAQEIKTDQPDKKLDLTSTFGIREFMVQRKEHLSQQKKIMKYNFVKYFTQKNLKVDLGYKSKSQQGQQDQANQANKQASGQPVLSGENMQAPAKDSQQVVVNNQ